VRYNVGMRNEFTAIIESDGKWYVAYCAEVPGANGQVGQKLQRDETWRKPSL
jgi:hypothetical protein